MAKLLIQFEDAPPITIYYPASEAVKVKSVLKLCSDNDLAMRLIKLLAQQYTLSIHFTPQKMIANGCWLVEQQQIHIKSTLSVENTLQTLIFECCNAFNPLLKNIPKESFASASDYAVYMEEAEYRSYQLAYHIYDHGIKNALWPKPQNTQMFEESLSKENWMKKTQRLGENYKGFDSHFDIYTSFFKLDKGKDKLEAIDEIKKKPNA